jgi:hypothetical protein
MVCRIDEYLKTAFDYFASLVHLSQSAESKMQESKDCSTVAQASHGHQEQAALGSKLQLLEAPLSFCLEDLTVQLFNEDDGCLRVLQLAELLRLLGRENRAEIFKVNLGSDLRSYFSIG